MSFFWFRYSFILSLALAPFALATSNNFSMPEKRLDVAESDFDNLAVAEITNDSSADISLAQISFQELELALHNAINVGDVNAMEMLLIHYQTQPNTDPILIDFAYAQIAYQLGDYPLAVDFYRKILAQNSALTPVRIQLATSLFLMNFDSEAKNQFEVALSDQALPSDIRALVERYLLSLNRRNGWQFDLGANYLRERNVNNASNAVYIENTPFKKNDSMLPQKANGIAYTLGIERDFNLYNAHFLHFENRLYGKNYWDNKSFNDISNRTYLGYRHKQGAAQFSLLPFYELQWYSNARYRRSQGGRITYSKWIRSNWQFSTALEYAKQYYFRSQVLNGNNKLISNTLLWRIKPSRFVYIGVDLSRESTVVKRYSYDLKTARIGWGEEWGWGISSRMSFNYSKRDYKANLALLANGNFSIDRTRKDKIYIANATIWKRDWHLFGITPKLNLRWKQQKSNFPTLYSYIDKSANLLLETSF